MKKLAFIISLGIVSAISSSLSFAQCTNLNEHMRISKADSRYTDNKDGTISDKATHLMWQKCSVGQIWNATSNSCDGTASDVSWPEAMAYAPAVNALEQYGHNDWRMPNRNELLSLAEPACFEPSINETFFPNTAVNDYWSSSSYGSDSIWLVNFTEGRSYAILKTNGSLTRLVRSLD